MESTKEDEVPSCSKLLPSVHVSALFIHSLFDASLPLLIIASLASTSSAEESHSFGNTQNTSDTKTVPCAAGLPPFPRSAPPAASARRRDTCVTVTCSYSQSSTRKRVWRFDASSSNLGRWPPPLSHRGLLVSLQQKPFFFWVIWTSSIDRRVERSAHDRHLAVCLNIPTEFSKRSRDSWEWMPAHTPHTDSQGVFGEQVTVSVRTSLLFQVLMRNQEYQVKYCVCASDSLGRQHIWCLKKRPFYCHVWNFIVPSACFRTKQDSQPTDSHQGLG